MDTIWKDGTMLRTKRSLRLFTLAPMVLLGIGLLNGQTAGDGFVPDEAFYGTGSWDADSLGNHRVVIRVNEPADIVTARIPWRRRDPEPEKRHIYIVDGATENIVTEYKWKSVNREFGEVTFRPPTSPGTYYIHYLLYRHRGSRNYPKGYYLPFRAGDESFLADRSARRAEAELVQFQAIDTFNTFYPMEIIATKAEVERLMLDYPDVPYLVFPEDRSNAIRMTQDLPATWIPDGPQTQFNGTADRGEYYTFQAGVYAMRTDVTELRVSFTDLTAPSGVSIPASAFTCFNTEGIDWEGKRFSKAVSVKEGRVQALWMGVQIPEDARPGTYSTRVTIAPKELSPHSFTLSLNVSEDLLADAGDSDPYRLSRLRWLNSQLALDDEIVLPFEPVRVDNRSIHILGRTVDLTPEGLPSRIRSFFSTENTSLTDDGREVLASPVRIGMETKQGGMEYWKNGRLEFGKRAEGIATWTSSGSVGSFDVSMTGAMEFDGFLDFRITLRATEDTNIEDICLEVPMERSATRYMMGLGQKGGYRPDSYDWRWDRSKNHDAVWLGDVNAGLQLRLYDENYVRPLNTNFYLLKPLNMPPSWYNDSLGGMTIRETDVQTVQITAYSGPRTVKKGETLHFYWSLLLTPFKLIDTDTQWATRFYHRYVPVDTIVATGANTVNIHHATYVNPYINYPFLRPQAMKAYADSAHDKGMRMKIYYTVRELSNRSPEMPMLFSLGHEVLSGGKGGGFSWLQEHLDQDYIAAWFVPPLKDAAVINSGISRWHNYYVEGLQWLVQNVGIDGLYIDDVAFDRTTMKRVRKVLARSRPHPMIDLHSANQYNVRDGFVNSANLYLEHFPYIDRLWFGEYFDYGSAPDFWMVEVSGIPFGLMGEMLQGGGNPWRGMVYGMTARLPWAGDPRPMWKIWDEFGMQGTTMYGYWSPNCPVRTSDPSVRATAYVKQGRTLLALASWNEQSVDVRLTIDWDALGLDPSRTSITAPESSGLQTERSFRPDEVIPVEAGKGWILTLTQD